MYQVTVPEGVAEGMQFQVNLGGSVVTATCPPGVGPGMAIQVQGPATVQVAVAASPAVTVAPGTGVAPPSAHMKDDLERVLGPQSGFLMRQKLDLMEAFMPCNKRNTYKVATLPTGLDLENEDDWSDGKFKKALKHGKILKIKEESEDCQRYCLGSMREFTADVTSSKKTGAKTKIATFFRPFKCTCCGGICAPQEISSMDKDGKTLGRSVQEFRCSDCCCGKRRMRLEDASGTAQYYVVDNTCCNANYCAPTICCPFRKMEIYKADNELEPVGSLTNIFPGCTGRGFVGNADNYRCVFPQDASPEMKLQFLATTMLIDFMLFENQKNDNNDTHHAL